MTTSETFEGASAADGMRYSLELTRSEATVILVSLDQMVMGESEAEMKSKIIRSLKWRLGQIINSQGGV